MKRQHALRAFETSVAMFTVLFNRVVELEASNKQLEATAQGWMQVSHDLLKLNEGLKEILGAHLHA